MLEEFTFKFEGRTYEALIEAKDLGKKPDFVFLHGAGAGTKERVFSFSEAIVEQGNSIFAFDHSGAGKDANNMRNSSLEKRVNEARYAIEKFTAYEDLTVCGASMGGYIAIKMLEYFPIKNLVLFCPAVYDRRAYRLPFDEKFTEVIRQENSWRNTDVLPTLQKFDGKLLILIGDLDEVIPRGVIDLIYRNSSNAYSKELIRIPNCPHKIQIWLEDHPDIAQKVSEKVAEVCY